MSSLRSASGQLPLVAFRLEPGHDASYDESDIAWQLSAERGWMVPAYTLPPNAQNVKIMRALVKETMGREHMDRLTRDLANACATLDQKGGTTQVEREQTKMGTGYCQLRIADRLRWTDRCPVIRRPSASDVPVTDWSTGC